MLSDRANPTAARFLDQSLAKGEPMAEKARAAEADERIELLAQRLARSFLQIMITTATTRESEQEPDATFGATLRRFRTAEGVSQRQLAIRAHVDPASVNRIELEGRRPRVETVVRLVRALGYDLADPRGRALLQAADVEPEFAGALGAGVGQATSQTPGTDLESLEATVDAIEMWLNGGRASSGSPPAQAPKGAGPKQARTDQR